MQTSEAPESFSRRDAMGLIALTLGVALIVVDMSIVNLVLPQMATDLDLGFSACSTSACSSRWPAPRS